MLVRVYLLMWQRNEKGAECAQTECSNKVNYIFYFAWFWRTGYVITSDAAGTGAVAEQNSCKLHIQFVYWSYRMGRKALDVTRKTVPVRCWGPETVQEFLFFRLCQKRDSSLLLNLVERTFISSLCGFAPEHKRCLNTCFTKALKGWSALSQKVALFLCSEVSYTIVITSECWGFSSLHICSLVLLMAVWLTVLVQENTLVHVEVWTAHLYLHLSFIYCNVFECMWTVKCAEIYKNAYYSALVYYGGNTLLHE